MRLSASVATVLLAMPAAEAAAIPAFARRYRASCNVCHNPIPALTAFGERFAANGFRFAPDEEPGDTVATGDDLLLLQRSVPLAMRLDAYVQAYDNGGRGTDFQSPWNLKVLSGGPLSRTVSYYLYFFLAERGEVGGIEDAFVFVNDVFGLPVDVMLGQFQVSDPLFKRELRLEYQDYAVYRARVGDQPADLTYDRGLMVTADLAGFTLTGEVVNGNGKGEAGANRRLDDDVGKSLVLHLSRDVGSRLRLGVLGYSGRQRGARPDSAPVTNRLRMAGVDGTVSLGPVELNGQYLYREDDAPTFSAGEIRVRTEGGFLEAILRPRERWSLFGLYNRIEASRPLLDVRLGGEGGLRRYEAATLGVGYLVQRNLRVTAEVTRDLGVGATTLTGGLVTAF